MKKITLFLFILFLTQNVWTQTFNNFTTSDGLGADCINVIAIDLLGNKWFGTTQLFEEYIMLSGMHL